jgi:hypothetical protein
MAASVRRPTAQIGAVRPSLRAAGTHQFLHPLVRQVPAQYEVGSVDFVGVLAGDDWVNAALQHGVKRIAFEHGHGQYSCGSKHVVALRSASETM